MTDPQQKTAEGSRIVRCPRCAGDSVYASSNQFRPFCSERCKRADLGAWASEDYRLPAQPRAGDLPDDDGESPHAGDNERS